METVGEFFKQARETKGLTLDAVASKTCIHPDFLRSLEDNNFAKLPDQVFAKGFVRSYARSLGLDENEAMRRFGESAGPFYEKQGERERLRQKQVEDERRRKTNRQVAAASAVVALLALILLLTHEQSAVAPQRRTPPPPPVVAEPPPLVSKSEPEVPPQERSDGPPAELAPEGRESHTPPVESLPVPASVPRPGEVQGRAVTDGSGTSNAEHGATSNAPLVLDLEALEITWVLVRIDSASPQEVLLRPGDRIHWKASEQFILTLGNAGGVRIVLNGKEQGPFGPKGKVAREIVLKRS